MYLVFEMACIRAPCFSASSAIPAQTKGAPASEKKRTCGEYGIFWIERDNSSILSQGAKLQHDINMSILCACIIYIYTANFLPKIICKCTGTSVARMQAEISYHMWRYHQIFVCIYIYIHI